MGQSFDCTSCGAGLEYNGGSDHTIRCQYCGTNVPVPEGFWREAEEKQTVNKWGKYLIIFLVLVIGMPTCLGLVGTILGIGGSLIAIIAGFLAPFAPSFIKIFVH
jgi:LSD1 subclass zinc finger protein